MCLFWYYRILEYPSGVKFIIIPWNYINYYSCLETYINKINIWVPFIIAHFSFYNYSIIWICHKMDVIKKHVRFMWLKLAHHSLIIHLTKRLFSQNATNEIKKWHPFIIFFFPWLDGTGSFVKPIILIKLIV